MADIEALKKLRDEKYDDEFAAERALEEAYRKALEAKMLRLHAELRLHEAIGDFGPRRSKAVLLEIRYLRTKADAATFFASRVLQSNWWAQVTGR